MKILQLGKFYPIYGGVEKVMWDLTEGLSRSGTDCDMLCASLDREAVKKGVLPFNEHGRVFIVRSWKKAAGTMIAPGMVSWLWKHGREYDLIHVHHPDPMACLALWLSGYKGRVILHWHSDIVKQKIFLPLYRPLQSWLIRRAERIVGTTPVYVKESPYLQAVQDKVTYVPIGIDPVRADAAGAAAIRSRYPGKKIVYSLGRLVPYKGYDHLVASAQYLPDGYQVLIGGTGPQEQALNEEIIRFNLKNKVSLLGFIGDESLAAYYGACDVFVLSSTMKTEAFGIVQIEAMSCGKPVVATTIPESGVSWVNADGVSGLNVPPEDDKALADAVVAICGGTRYGAFSAGAAQRFRDLYTKEKMIEKIKAIYENEI